jgi:Nif-specific regulatory protein
MNVPVEKQASLALVSIYEISKILTGSQDLSATLRSVLNMMSSYMAMRRGVVALIDEDGTLEVAAAAGLSHNAVTDGVADIPGEIAARILGGEAPFVSEDVADEPFLAEYVRIPDVLEDEHVAFLAVPIKTTGKPFGLLGIARVWSDALSVNYGDDIRFLTMVANLIAQSVKLHASLRANAAAGLSDVAPPPRIKPPARHLVVENVIGASRSMQQVFAQIHLVAPTKSTVIVRGESGTGKELIARAVHTLSPRQSAPFVSVNCAALPDSLLESELFGHEKGAFTGATQDRKGRFELANGGTLFLDEIGEISTGFQAKLLRVLQEKEFERVGGTKTLKVDFRLVCATNKNLEDAVAKGDFRADLYYRINVVPVFVPALRERREDIPTLAEHFLDVFNKENDRNLRFTEKAVRVLTSCGFPGNVRELENCVVRVATMTTGDVIDEVQLPCQAGFCPCASLSPQSATSPGTSSGAVSGDLEGVGDWDTLDDLKDLDALPQRERLVRVMEKAGWVQAKAARMLGMTPRQIGYALRKYNIDIKRL